MRLQLLEKDDFHVFSKNDPDLAHRDEVAGGAVGVQHLDGLAEGDVAHRERSRKAGRRPDPVVVVMQVFLKSGLDCSPQLCLDIVERLSNIVDVLVCLGQKIDLKIMSRHTIVPGSTTWSSYSVTEATSGSKGLEEQGSISSVVYEVPRSLGKSIYHF